MTRPVRLFAFALVLTSLGSVMLEIQMDMAADPDEPLGAILWRLARFFTILTNVMVGVTFLRMALVRRNAGTVWLGGLTLWISITGVVYHALLARELSGLPLVSDHGLHTVTPLLTVVYWVLYGPKRGLRVTHALTWLIWPLLYVAYALIRGQLDGTYPYFFTDPTRVGWLGVLRWSGILCAAFFASGLTLVGLSKVLR